MSVFIQIDEKTAITTDTYCWRVSELKYRKNRTDTWEPERFYPTLSKLLDAEVERRGMLSKAKSGTELLLARENAICTLSKALAPFSYAIHVTGPRPDTGNPVNKSQVTRIPVEKGPHGLKRWEQ